MNAEEIGTLSQGNSALSEMGEHNSEIRQHNFRNAQQYQSLIQGATVARKQRAGAELGQSNQELALGGTGLGLSAVERGRGVFKAVKQAQAFEGEGWNTLGDGAKASKVLAQYAKGSETVKAVTKGAKLAQTLGEAGASAVKTGASVARSASELPGTLARSGLLGSGAAGSEWSKLFSPENLPGGMLEAGQGLAGSSRNIESGALPGVKGLMNDLAPKGSAPAGVGGSLLKDMSPEERALQAGKSVEAGTGKLVEGLGKASSLAKGAGVLSGGMSAIEDISSGHIVGHNSQEKAGNELGIAAGVADVIGFFIPGMSAVGAALGVASGVESAVGASKEKQDKSAPKDISTGKTFASEKLANVQAPSAGALSLQSRGQVGVAPANVVKQSSSAGTSGAF